MKTRVAVLISGAGSSGNGLYYNLIGTRGFGIPGYGNRSAGVRIIDAPGNFVGGTRQAGGHLIGGSQPGQGNLISGNAQSGILIFSPTREISSNSNKVLGNLIGTDKAGAAALPGSMRCGRVAIAAPPVGAGGGA